jgi:hypothetical protein
VHSNPGLIGELIARPRWLAIGTMVAILAAASRFVSIGVIPPSIKVRHLAHATATTELIAGLHHSLRASTYSDNYVASAVPRAQALADMFASPEVRSQVARAAGIPTAQLAVDTPVWTDVYQIQQWPSAGKRDSQIIVENAPFRITVDVEDQAPIIEIAAQAPTPGEAAALAAGAGKGLNAYVSKLEDSTGTPPAQRYGVSQLVPIDVSPAGKAGLANVAGFTFAVVLFIWCGGMLFLSGLRVDLRAAYVSAKVPGNVDRSSLGSAAFVDPTAVPTPGTVE